MNVMETDTEAEDFLAAQEMDAREEQLRASTRALMGRIKTLERRGREIAAELEQGDATARLTGAVEDIEEDITGCRRQLYVLVSDALDNRYMPSDVEAWCHRAIEKGCVHPQLGSDLLSDLVRIRRVPNAPFRERALALLSDGATMSDITLAYHRHLLDVERETGQSHGSASVVTEDKGPRNQAIPQTRVMERILGIEGQNSYKDRMTLRLFITYEQATALARALDINPVDAGI